ncbi:MAG: hypothetical protein ACKVHU_02715 [Acidimicrobiales bacterium]|jgi:hypothetical protein
MSLNGSDDGDRTTTTTPSLFDAPFGADSAVDPDAPMAVGLDRLQLRIRELNEDRLSRQDEEIRLGRRRSAIARLRRRVAESDEVELSYWDRRRASLHIVGA